MKTNNFSQSRFSKSIKSLLSMRRRQVIGGIFFIIGALIGFSFNGLAVIANLNGASFWGDFFDAYEFNNNQPTQANLINIRCPILLAPGEDGIVTAVFQNSHPKKADILVKAFVDKRGFNNYRTVTGTLPIEPGDAQNFSWQVTGQDIVDGNFILTRVFLMNEYNTPYPARTDACGILVLSLFGLNGNSTIALMIITSLLCLAIGSFLLYSSNSPLQKLSPRVDYGLYGLAGILGISMIANLFGWWILAGLILLLAVLLTTILILNMAFQK